MNLNQLSIGQMAKLNRISEQTLRLYDKMNLLVPKIINPDNGYRYYTINQSAQLDLIKFYQHIGFSLKDIGTKLMTSDSDLLHTQLSRCCQNIDKEIEDLQESRQTVSRIIDKYHYFESLPKAETVFIEHLPAIDIITYDTEENLYEFSPEKYEYTMRCFKNHLDDIGVSPVLLTNFGTIIRQNTQQTHLSGHELFAVVESKSDKLKKTETIPEGTYISMCCNNMTSEDVYVKKMFFEIQKMKLNILGDFYCDFLSEYPLSDLYENNCCRKIRVRIS